MSKVVQHRPFRSGTPCYHCTSHYVRRAYYWGAASLTDECFSKRHHWIADRIAFLTSVFAIDVCDYQVLENHYKVTLNIKRVENRQWSEQEVCARWLRLFKGSFLAQKFRRDEPLSQLEYRAIQPELAQWRLNLCDISCFMRLLNEPFVTHVSNAQRRAKQRGAPPYGVPLSVV